MTYDKRFVCLANSQKFSGRCIAGIELTDVGLRNWVRPVSDRPSEELSIEERRYKDGHDVQVLDIVEVRFKQPRPHMCQTENHVIDDEYYWKFGGRFTAGSLLPIAVVDAPLWIDGYHSYSGENDRIPLDIADRLPSSLILIAIESATFGVAPGFKKRQVRAEFRLDSTKYSLTVTDPRVKAQYLAKPDGEYPYKNSALVCVSLGEPFEGHRYKLAASVIPIL